MRFVHIAGQLTGRIQLCEHCGVLISEGKHVKTGTAFAEAPTVPALRKPLLEEIEKYTDNCDGTITLPNGETLIHCSIQYSRGSRSGFTVEVDSSEALNIWLFNDVPKWVARLAPTHPHHDDVDWIAILPSTPAFEHCIALDRMANFVEYSEEIETPGGKKFKVVSGSHA